MWGFGKDKQWFTKYEIQIWRPTRSWCLLRRQFVLGPRNQYAYPLGLDSGRQSFAGDAPAARLVGCFVFPTSVTPDYYGLCRKRLGFPIPSITSIGHIPDEHDPTLYTIQYLTVLPDPRIVGLQQQGLDLPSSFQLTEDDSTSSFVQLGAAWDLDVSFTINISVKRVGLVITHSIGICWSLRIEQARIYHLQAFANSIMFPQINKNKRKSTSPLTPKHSASTEANLRVHPISISQTKPLRILSFAAGFKKKRLTR